MNDKINELIRRFRNLAAKNLANVAKCKTYEARCRCSSRAQAYANVVEHLLVFREDVKNDARKLVSQ